MAIIIPFCPRPQVEASQAASKAVNIGNAVAIPFPGAESSPARPPDFAPTPRKRGGTKEEDQRKSMLSKIHMAIQGNKRKGDPGLFATLPGFTEDVYRHALRERWNSRSGSAADLSNADLHQVLVWLCGLGFKPARGRNRQYAPDALIHDSTGMGREARLKKIEAMLAEKGRVEGTDTPWAYAVAILKRQTANDPAGQIKSFDKANPDQLDDVIAALYRDAGRKGRRVR